MSNKSRACDRCHRYKERCIIEEGASSCVLCHHSALPCTTMRTQRRRGRRPTAKLLGPDTWIQLWEVEGGATEAARSHIETALQPSHLMSEDSSGTDAPAFRNPFDSSPGILERFAAKYDLFMIGPSFASRFRVALQKAYLCAPVLLQDIFTVILTALKNGEHYTSMWQQLNTTKGATSLQILRTVQVTNSGCIRCHCPRSESGGF